MGAYCQAADIVTPMNTYEQIDTDSMVWIEHFMKPLIRHNF